MRISREQLQKIIAEEVRAHVKKKLVSESVSKPRTIKATPAMLKRIIAEEAAKINEASDGGGSSRGRRMGQGAPYLSPGRELDGSQDPLDDPDNILYKDDYEDVNALEDKYAEEHYKENVDFYKRYLMTSNFASAVRANASILVDVKTKKIICDLKKYSSCANEIVDKLNKHGVSGLLYSDPETYQKMLFDILNSYREDGEELFNKKNTAIASIHLIHEVLGIEIEKEEDILTIRYPEHMYK